MARHLFVDVETTGFGAGDRVVEVAIVAGDDNGTRNLVFESVLNPEMNLRNRSIHALNNRFLRVAPTFASIAAQLAEVLRGHHGVAHNAPFDARMLTQEFRRAGFDALLPMTCTLQLARQRKFKGKTLHELADALKVGVDGEDRHRASYDAALAFEVFRTLGSPISPEGGQLMSVRSPPPPLPPPRQPMNRERNRLIALGLEHRGD